MADVGEASVNGERAGEGDTGVDMMPGGYSRKGGREDDECQQGGYIELYRRKTLNMGGGRTGRRSVMGHGAGVVLMAHGM